ncbi:unnamed protein product [Schistosoma margrebowiei]|uniref:Uncharacterized protein n=1 Tax=Schistosoma margrebowiei TaxID=48269 RepID=A0A183MR75_9TREM|nr:unnamed protein product [Schistosoma margrebowiei]
MVIILMLVLAMTICCFVLDRIVKRINIITITFNFSTTIDTTNITVSSDSTNTKFSRDSFIIKLPFNVLTLSSFFIL